MCSDSEKPCSSRTSGASARPSTSASKRRCGAVSILVNSVIASLLPQPGGDRDLGPFAQLGLDVAAELVGAAADRLEALGAQRHEHVARRQRLVGGARELVDDLARRAGRR